MRTLPVPVDAKSTLSLSFNFSTPCIVTDAKLHLQLSGDLAAAHPSGLVLPGGIVTTQISEGIFYGTVPSPTGNQLGSSCGSLIFDLGLDESEGPHLNSASPPYDGTFAPEVTFNDLVGSQIRGLDLSTNQSQTNTVPITVECMELHLQLTSTAPSPSPAP